MKHTIYTTAIALAFLLHCTAMGQAAEAASDMPVGSATQSATPEQAAAIAPAAPESAASAHGEAKPRVRKPWPTIAWLGAVVAAIFAALMKRSRK